MVTKMRSAEAGTKNDSFELYLTLDENERALVELTAVLTAGTARTKLAAALRTLRVYESGTKPYTGKSLLSVIERLATKGVLAWDGSHARCHPAVIERVNRHLAAEGSFDAMAEAARVAVPLMRHTYRRQFHSREEAIREVRIAMYRHNESLLAELVDACSNTFPITASQPHPLVQICQNPFDGQWLVTFPPSIVECVVAAWLESGISILCPVGDVLPFLREWPLPSGQGSDAGPDAGLDLLAAELHLLRGEFDDVRRAAAEYGNHAIVATLEAAVELLTGDTQAALAQYEKAYEAVKKKTRKRKVYLPYFSGLLHVLALLKAGDAESLARAEAVARAGSEDRKNYWQSAYHVLQQIVALRTVGIESSSNHRSHALYLHEDWLCVLLGGLLTLWQDRPEQDDVDITATRLAELQRVSAASGYTWLAAEAADVASQLQDRAASPASEHAAFREKSGAVGLVEFIPYQEPWQRALDALLLVRRDPSADEKNQAPADTRMVWLVDCDKSQRWFRVAPLLQKRTQRGWTKGRNVSLKRLRLEPDMLDCLTHQDRRICTCIEEEIYGRGWGGRYAETEYTLDAGRAMPHLIGHPLVFWEQDRETHIEVVAGQPELVVTEKKGEIRLKFEPPLPEEVNGSSTVIVKESERRIKVISVTAEQRHVARILGPAGLKAPAKAVEQVRTTLASLTSLLTVHSDVGLVDSELPTVDADPRAHVHLFPLGEGLRAELLVRPFPGAETTCRPGEGRETVIAEVEGRRQQARRDLKAERRHAARVLDACRTLKSLDEGGGPWAIDDPVDCLEVLTELQDLQDMDEVVVAWPEGEKMKVTAPVSISQFRVSIRSAQDWFSASGKLHVDENRVLDMRQLLDLIKQTPTRFLPLGDRQFVALTHEFRKRLEEVQAYTELSGKGVRIHPLTAAPLAEVLDEVGSLRADKSWKDQLDRLQAAQQLEPQLPSTFCGELRDYQLDGYRWLQRLAHLGAGACLADDMGLGKTIQVLATLIERGNDGPALVVAPTSVCPNWQREAARFAPTLNVIRFGYDNADRGGVVDALGSRDVLVTSYALLQQEIEMLSQCRFRTIVLDEAQAIKNMGTKRSQAAMALQGDFRIITTGTPIENHLGDLWNLFRFINPGLLRSSADFNRRFAVPIEKEGDANARGHLKKLIHPFVLRRTKDQVLDELPPRTEIVLEVEMSVEEAALYESLRQAALERLEEGGQKTKAKGQRHLQVLAELMKLRRMCCNPKLLLPDWRGPESKLTVFAETLEELIENRHKVLVFSQFVDHLTILREFLDQRGVTYQYLDGSTPARQRQQRIDAFQAGDGDVFLISLKAGGVGLNLTAADYVIHMDPWWNPAVEDQASDRAHRIGQQRPVTIYRLVTKGTIEEKIVELHHRKRDLAQQLLDGADVSGKMSVDQLIKILRDA